MCSYYWPFPFLKLRFSPKYRLDFIIQELCQQFSDFKWGKLPENPDLLLAAEFSETGNKCYRTSLVFNCFDLKTYLNSEITRFISSFKPSMKNYLFVEEQSRLGSSQWNLDGPSTAKTAVSIEFSRGSCIHMGNISWKKGLKVKKYRHGNKYFIPFTYILYSMPSFAKRKVFIF